MDSIFGLQGNDWVIVACDGSVAHSILKIKETEDKILKLDDQKIFGISGEGAARNSFGELVHKNHCLNRYRTGTYYSTKEAAHFIRSLYASALRSRDGPYQCNSLLGGIDQDGTASLYWMDYLGSLQKITRGAQGYANYFLLGLLDNEYRPNLTKQDGVEIVKKCIKELQTRFLIAQNKFIVKIVTKEGIEVLTL